MKIYEIITSIIEKEVQFNGLTLLSKEEYFELKENIPKVEFWWWLRSPGLSSLSACDVYDYGRLGGSPVNNDYDAVRPALILASESNFIIGDKFIFDNHHWTVVSNEYALCDDKYCYMWFREDWKASDANVYDASDIKKYIDDEWSRMNLEE